MTVPHAPEPGETVSGGRLASGHGGKGSNQAIAIRRLGMPASLFTAVGRDAAADDAFAFWAAEGVDATGVVRSDEATMTGFILVDPSGENRIAIADGALGALAAEEVDGFAETIGRSSLLVVSLEVPVAVASRAAELAHELGVRVLLNPAPAVADRALVAAADILTPNRGELGVLAGAPGASADEALDLLRTWYRGTVIVTCGADGAIVDDASGRYQVPSLAVPEVVDTTGAGDAFTAALAVAVVEGRPIREAVAFAAAAGAHAVTRPEVIPALATRAELDALIGTPA
jgi:ribokinase